jgi:hypothetical protein
MDWFQIGLVFLNLIITLIVLKRQHGLDKMMNDYTSKNDAKIEASKMLFEMERLSYEELIKQLYDIERFTDLFKKIISAGRTIEDGDDLPLKQYDKFRKFLVERYIYIDTEIYEMCDDILDLFKTLIGSLKSDKSKKDINIIYLTTISKIDDMSHDIRASIKNHFSDLNFFSS